MLPVAGKGLPQMERFITMHAALIFEFLLENTTLQMLVLASVMHFWSHFEASGTILLSGDGLLFGKYMNTFLNCTDSTPRSPANREELFNLRHASARNVIERIFGVVKRRWSILVNPPQFDMDTQARVLPALCAIHNIILKHDPDDMKTYEHDDEGDPQPGERSSSNSDFGELAEGPARDQEKTRASAKRDQIAQDMWDDYQTVLRARGLLDE
jgi:hypothetical protein